MKTTEGKGSVMTLKLREDLCEITGAVDKFAGTLEVRPPTANDLRAIIRLIAKIRGLSEAHG
jgi:DNA/RNA endonuclease YhcR with UshA esterase domain